MKLSLRFVAAFMLVELFIGWLTIPAGLAENCNPAPRLKARISKSVMRQRGPALSVEEIELILGKTTDYLPQSSWTAGQVRLSDKDSTRLDDTYVEADYAHTGCNWIGNLLWTAFQKSEEDMISSLNAEERKRERALLAVIVLSQKRIVVRPLESSFPPAVTAKVIANFRALDGTTAAAVPPKLDGRPLTLMIELASNKDGSMFPLRRLRYPVGLAHKAILIKE